MPKNPQKPERKRSEVYAQAPVSRFGQRSPDFSTMGRKIDNQYAKHRKVVIVQACRTPYGRLGGKLAGYDGPQLGALAIQEVLRRVEGKVSGQDVDLGQDRWATASLRWQPRAGTRPI